MEITECNYGFSKKFWGLRVGMFTTVKEGLGSKRLAGPRLSFVARLYCWSGGWWGGVVFILIGRYCVYLCESEREGRGGERTIFQRNTLLAKEVVRCMKR